MFILLLMFIVHRTSLTQDFFLSFLSFYFTFFFQNVYVPTLEEEGSKCFRLGALLQSIHRSCCDCHGDHRVDNTDCPLEDDEAAEEEALGSKVWNPDPRSGVKNTFNARRSGLLCLHRRHYDQLDNKPVYICNRSKKRILVA